MTTCKNCGQPVAHHFCGHCGQSVEVGRIDAAYVVREAFEFATNVQRRFISTAWRLLVSPGAVAEEFIEGRRRKYQPPISYFLIWTTIYILVLSLIQALSGQARAIDYADYFGPGRTTGDAISHLAIVLALIIPVQAALLYALITRRRFTYFESVAAAVYLIGTIILLQTAFVIAGWLLHLAGEGPVNLASSDILKLVYLTWFAADLSRRFSLEMKPLRVATFAAVAIAAFSLWRVFGVPWLLQHLHLAARDSTALVG